MSTGMPGEDKQHSRFAELTMELMGSQLTAKVMEQVWSEATPEVRARLATAVLEKIEATIRDQNNWDLRKRIEVIVDAVTTERIEAEAPRLREMFLGSFATEITRGITEIVNQGSRRLIERNLRTIAQSLEGAVEQALRALPR